MYVFVHLVVLFLITTGVNCKYICCIEPGYVLSSSTVFELEGTYPFWRQACFYPLVLPFSLPYLYPSSPDLLRPCQLSLSRPHPNIIYRCICVRYMYVYVYINVCVSIYTCIYIYICVYVYVCVCIYIWDLYVYAYPYP